MSYIENLRQLLGPMAGNASRVQIKRLVMRPLFDEPYLRAQRFSSATSPDNRITVAIGSVWTSLAAGDLPAAFQATVAAIGVTGLVVRQQDVADQSVSVKTLVGVLISLAEIGMKLSAKAKISRQPLLDALRLEYAHFRRDAKVDSDKRVGMALCLVEIIKICVSDRVPGIVDSLIASGAGILDTEEDLPKSVSITLKFFMAKHLLFLDEFEAARTELLVAYRRLPHNKPQSKNEESILWYLIPLQLSQGLYPSIRILKKYPRLSGLYKPLLKAVRRMDVGGVRTQLLATVNSSFFFLSKRIELLVFRGLLKQVYDVSIKKRRVELDLLAIIFDLPNKPSLVEEIVANLILCGMITGYISYEEQAVMLTGSNPFPYGPFIL